jgi:DNA-binding Xre family transcriptional regulator
MVKKKKILVTEVMPEFDAGIKSIPADRRIFIDKSIAIAHRIFQVMEEKGLNQKHLANKMDISEEEVNKLLGGMHNLNLRMIAKLEAALETTMVSIPGDSSSKA